MILYVSFYRLVFLIHPFLTPSLQVTCLFFTQYVKRSSLNPLSPTHLSLTGHLSLTNCSLTHSHQRAIVPPPILPSATQPTLIFVLFSWFSVCPLPSYISCFCSVYFFSLSCFFLITSIWIIYSCAFSSVITSPIFTQAKLSHLFKT